MTTGKAQPLTMLGRHGYLADDQRALFGRGHGWFAFHIVMDNHGFHRFRFTIAQIQRRPVATKTQRWRVIIPQVEDSLV